MKWSFAMRWLMLIATAMALLTGSVLAEQRDPTRAPAAANVRTVGAAERDADAPPELPDVGHAAVLVRDGAPLLVLGPQSFSQGQKMGAYTLVRISETEVWLRNGKTLHKLPIFSGIERHAATLRPSP